MIKPIGGYSDNNHPSGGNPAEVNYAMFLGVWTLLSMALFIPLALKPQSKESYLISTTVLDGLTTLFHMCDAIALAAAMGIHNCNNKDYVFQNRITNNALDRPKRCREAQAATAFIWINFLLFVLTTAISVRTIYWNSNPKDDVEDSPNTSEISTGGPAVSNVPLQSRNFGISRFWGRRTVALTGGPEVAAGGKHTSGSAMSRFWRRKMTSLMGEAEIADNGNDNNHNWRTERASSIEGDVIPEVDCGHNYRS